MRSVIKTRNTNRLSFNGRPYRLCTSQAKACLSLLFFAVSGLCAETAAPFQKLWIGSGEKEMKRYLDYGCTATIAGDITRLATFDGVCPGVIAEDSALRRQIEQMREKFQKDYDEAAKLGLALVAGTDEVALPVPVAEWLKKKDTRNKKPVWADWESDLFWQVYRAKYSDVLKAYPKIAYVLIRTGENYSRPEQGYVAQRVMGRTIDDDYFRRMTRLIEETRRVVVDECGRTLIWRTWDLGNDKFHANTNVYDRILAGVTDRKGLVFSVKHTQTDFWRYNDFNPTIGRGGVEQIIEYQCAREYEGKGAFPNYVGPLHAEDMLKSAQKGAVGVWLWHFGGGSGGPKLASDRWVRLNIYATSRLVKDPKASPRTLAAEWAAQEFGAKAATDVAAMLMLSPEFVLKFRYIAPYAREHRGWKPSENLMRDDIIRGASLRQLYDGSKHALSEVFVEKEEAVALAGRMRALFERTRPAIVAERGERVYQEALSSLLYMESLAKVVCHYVSGMFLYYQWQETRDTALAERARRELEAWRAAWREHTQDIPKLPGVASRYRSVNVTSETEGASGGDTMAGLCESALRRLAESR